MCKECVISIKKIENHYIAYCGNCNDSLDIISCEPGINPLPYFNLNNYCSNCGIKILRGAK